MSRRFLSKALIIGPLIRYENFAITLPMALYFFIRGMRMKMVISVIILVCITAGFSLFLIHVGFNSLYIFLFFYEFVFNNY